MHPIHHRVVHGFVARMPPPEEHIGVGQPLLGESVLGVVERRRVHHGVGAEDGPQACGDRLVHAVGVQALRRLVVLLVVVLAPHQDLHRTRLRHSVSSGSIPSTCHTVGGARPGTTRRSPHRRRLNARFARIDPEYRDLDTLVPRYSILTRDASTLASLALTRHAST
jgi:hypothetical protein